jgi:hypothetical protein
MPTYLEAELKRVERPSYERAERQHCAEAATRRPPNAAGQGEEYIITVILKRRQQRHRGRRICTTREKQIYRA